MLQKLFLSMCLLGAPMLNAAKEIELKISVSAAQYEDLEFWAADNAQYMGESEQKEFYLRNPNDEWDLSAGFKDTLRTLRVRLEKKGDSVCCKLRRLDPVTKKTTHRDEYETKVENGDAALTIFAQLGFTEQTVVSKKRVTYLVNDTFEIVFDEVDCVGKFIEVELKKPIDDVKAGTAMIEDFLREIGLTSFKQYDRGYIHMIWNPGYEFGVERDLSN